MMKVLRVDVYSYAVCDTSVGDGAGAPIQVYVVPSTRISPVQPRIWPLHGDL